ncbi:hypothetical protein KVR01_011519 [Diaporthe batatas]|uniref:uncharacterized protein n=1 Tax=Diaporthe batatas TaxID=748121 RepID=UPI001D04CFC2|nr:uncharacterized protein KVR01_011519 [Diaporthe batatas]KAG8158397.1 hypothetical protein KVR01_011519 [Diaporthe batatas]
MKLTSNIALATLAAQASALVQLEVRYSDTMIPVGDLDIFAATYQAIYAEKGNQRSVMTDRTFQTFDNQCKPAEEPNPDLDVQVKINGAWGRTPGLKDNEMREGLVAAMWEVIQRVSNPTGYEVWSDCRGFTWQESVKYTPDAACGPKSSRSCKDQCPAAVQCMKHAWGHSVPSSMRVTAYIDDRLQPDDLIIEFGSRARSHGGGCGMIGDIAGELAGYVIPVVGGLFAKGISLGCSN